MCVHREATRRGLCPPQVDRMGVHHRECRAHGVDTSEELHRCSPCPRRREDKAVKASKTTKQRWFQGEEKDREANAKGGVAWWWWWTTALRHTPTHTSGGVRGVARASGSDTGGLRQRERERSWQPRVRVCTLRTHTHTRALNRWKKRRRTGKKGGRCHHGYTQTGRHAPRSQQATGRTRQQPRTPRQPRTPSARRRRRCP